MRTILSIIFLTSFFAPSFAQEFSDEQIRLLDNSAWQVDLESPEFGLGDGATYTCESPLLINVTKDGRSLLMKFGNDGPKWTAEIKHILEPEKFQQRFVIEYENESRVGDEGKTLQWVFNLTKDNRFFWQAKTQSSDYFKGYTRMRVRCEEQLGS